MLQQLVNGLILGSVYALLALGYTMVYGIIKLINFAHGDLFMMGAFIGYYLINVFHLNLFVALLLTMVFTACLGMLIEFLAYRPLRHSTRIAALITAIGVSFLLEYGMVYLVGAEARAFPQALKTVKYSLGPVSISNVQMIILLVSILLMIGLQFVVKQTKMGKAMRAVSVDSDAAQLMGINVNSTISFTFALGSALAGAAGVLIGLYYNSINPLMGMTPGIKAFVAAVLGGIGIIPGAALGVAEIIRMVIVNGGDITNGAAGLTGILRYSTWPVVFIFVVLIAVAMLNFLRSSIGRQVISVRENEIAAESMGVNTTKIKVLTFTFAAMTASIAGSLYVAYIGTVVPKDFTIMRSIDYLIIAVLGGLGSMTGTILAAIVLGVLNMYLQSFSDIRMIIYSIALILVMVFKPGGLMGTKELVLSDLLFNKKKEGK